MKRWMLFANNFIKENLSIKTLIIPVIPSLLPLFMLIISIISGIKYLTIFLLIHLLKITVYRQIRTTLLKNNEPMISIIYELVADYLQAIHYVHAVLSPRHIQWRSKVVELNKGQVRFT